MSMLSEVEHSVLKLVHFLVVILIEFLYYFFREDEVSGRVQLPGRLSHNT